MNKASGWFPGVVSLQPPSTFVQLLLVGSDFCPGGGVEPPNPPGKSSTAYNTMLRLLLYFFDNMENYATSLSLCACVRVCVCLHR